MIDQKDGPGYRDIASGGADAGYQASSLGRPEGYRRPEPEADSDSGLTQSFL
jgi:hypothetical protein